MKNTKSTLLIIGLLLIGVGSFFIYNRQQENQFLKFEGYEVSLIENKVNKLYNKDKTDLADDITIDKLNEVEQLILDIEEKEFSDKNKTKLKSVIDDFGKVRVMNELELSIDKVFEEDSEIVKIDINGENILKLEDKLENFQEKSKYYSRNKTRLISASEQIEKIKLVQERLDDLFEDGELSEDVTHEELEEVKELINSIKNSEIKDSLLARIENVEVASTEEEEPEEDTDEIEEEDEEEVEVVREPEPERTPEREVEPEPEPTRPSRPTPPEPDSTPEPPADPIVVSEKEENGETVEIPFETSRINNATLPEGQQAIVQYGKPGQGVVIYKVTTFSDGTETRSKLRTDVIRNPENRIIQVGTATVETEEDSE